MPDHIAAFEKTVQRTYEWIDDVAFHLQTQDRKTAYAVLRATLHALRDRLDLNEGAQLAAQMPMLLRGLYYEEWDPSTQANKERHKEYFLARVREGLRNYEHLDVERAVRAVFMALESNISRGEVKDVVSLLPRDLRDLWPGVNWRAA